MTDDARKAGLTKAQAWALQAIADGYGKSPAYLGQRMMERPGVEDQRRGGNRNSPQGLGRVGGTMMARLREAGFATTSGMSNGQWRATEARITEAGLAALALAEGRQP